MSDCAGETTRIILFYKGDISALTLFVQHPHGSICAPQPLPKLSAALEPGAPFPSGIIQHPAPLVRCIAETLGFPDDLLAAQPGFCERVETPSGVVTVFMGRFMLLDPPHALLRERHCRLLTLTELRRQPQVELELLRRAYAAVMEG
jgi:hypothetical protein